MKVLPRKAMLIRFWAKVDVRGPDECWPWTSTIAGGRYGQFWLDGKYVLAHRLAWEMAAGESPPPGLYVCHSCDNPPCCNARHLFLGTPRQNQQDMHSKGRANRRWGERSNLAKLSNATAASIKARVVAGETQAALAREFGVTPSNVSHMMRGRSRSKS